MEKTGRGIYCSKKCYTKARSILYLGEKSSNWRGGKIKRVCQECGKTFEVTPHIVKIGKGKYCSRKCTSVAFSKKYRGENHHAWLGGQRKGYCEKFNGEFKNRIIAFWYANNENICPECNKPLPIITKPHCHHGYYDKMACCSISIDGKYFSNLGIKDREKTFEIIGDPNKFVPLHKNCHTKTNGKSKREFYARKYEKIINEKFGGKSYFTKEEYCEFLIKNPDWVPPYK
jgi:hypothetical protein